MDNSRFSWILREGFKIDEHFQLLLQITPLFDFEIFLIIWNDWYLFEYRTLSDTICLWTGTFLKCLAAKKNQAKALSGELTPQLNRNWLTKRLDVDDNEVFRVLEHPMLGEFLFLFKKKKKHF